MEVNDLFSNIQRYRNASIEANATVRPDSLQSKMRNGSLFDVVVNDWGTMNVFIVAIVGEGGIVDARFR